MWGYYRADPAAYASSQRLCVYGIWPTGTAKGTDRWWSSPARTGYDRDPRQSDPTHTTGAPHGSAPERSRRKCANRARHWRRPTWSVIPDRKPHMVELSAKGTETSFYVSKAIPISQLGERHRQILIPARKAARSHIAAVSRHATAKFAIWQVAQKLREDGSALVHAPLSSPSRRRLSIQSKFKSRQASFACKPQ